MSRKPFIRRAIAAVTALLVVGAGAVALDASRPAPAQAAYPDTFNPFSMNGGFTVYAREDALLRNQETEGSVAVGDTATVQGSSGTYTIIHVSAGTGDYTLPTVDGDPTRFLVGSYDSASTGILAITSAGTSDPGLWGDLKMVERDGPWQAFARADWLRLNTNPSNVDQTPLIDATHQQYPSDASPPSGTVGGNSIYTADTSATAVADYVEANAEASYDAAADCLDGLSSEGYPVGVAEDAGARVVLDPLSADRPNIVDYTDIAGTALIQFSQGPTPGVANPLIIRVPAGTTEVIGARTDPQGTYSPYIFWDLSALDGDVSVTAAEGGRIDGSIYAPNANLTVTAAPLDGQVLGQNVTIGGGEVHSYLFAGQISCEADSGTFEVSKSLVGIDTDDLPAGATFTVNYTATQPDGVTVDGTLEIPADGTAVQAGDEFPIGTVVEFEEVAPESVPGYEWGTPTITPNPLTVGAGTAEIEVENTATALSGTFSVSKTIQDLTTGDSVDDADITVPVTWVALYGGEQIGTGTLDVPADGTVVDVGEDFPVGTRILLTEDLTDIDPPEGYDWAGSSWNPGRAFVIDEDGEVVAVDLTNGITPTGSEPGRTIRIVKSAEGAAADPAYEYAVSYNTDPVGTRTTQELPVGDPVLLDDVETDADFLELAELVPTLDGDPVDPADWELPVITVTTDGEVQTFTPDNFEGAGPLESAIVEIPLEPGDQVISIDVSNALQEGTFELSKEFARIDGDSLPLDFTVIWTAVTPTGDTRVGTVRLPADGTPVSPLDAEGNPVTFPFGTVVSFAEQEPPRLGWLQWQESDFDPAEVVIGADGAATVASTLTNAAEVREGTFEVAKDLAGIDSDELLTDSFTIAYTALVPGAGVTNGQFEIPADGTPAGPVNGDGVPIEFPLGTIVRLAEVPPDPSVLPPNFAWAETTWSPGNTVIIRADQTTLLEVTNSVEELTRWAGVKVVQGDAASTIPDGTTFPVDWWWDYEAQTPVNVQPDVVTISRWFPVSSIIEVREQAPPDIAGVEWGEPVWTVDGETLTPDEEGKVVLPMTATRDDEIAELTLTNFADSAITPTPTPTPDEDAAGELSDTGGGGVPLLVPTIAVALIVLGSMLVMRRRQARLQ